MNITVQNLQLTDVTLYRTMGSLITKNTLSDGLCGIKMIESSNNKIAFNTINYNGYGLDLMACDDNEIVGNNVNSNREVGMLLTGSHSNTIRQNIVANNTVDGGIKLVHSSYNLVTENNVTENSKWGIRVLGEQQDNMIYNNNFFNNKVGDGLQVSMLGASSNTIANPSFWDNGTSGNYWSDYLTRYPNATEIDNTGVGDTPFYINPNNIDHYPLMEPFDIPEFPSWITVPLFITATISVLAIKKKLEKKK
jgi:parallel beta-helix repeat protein